MKKIKKIMLVFVALLLVGGLAACNSYKDKKIKVYTRDTTSGTRDGFFTGVNFKDAIKDNSVLVSGFAEIESNGAMINSVKNDDYGIGYISLATLKDSGLKGLNFNGVEPTEANVINKSYKLTRNFNYMLRNEYADTKVKDVAKALEAYMKTVEGIAKIKSADGIADATGAKSWNQVKAQHPIVDDTTLNITFRVGGSTSVEKVAKALTKAFKDLVKGTITFEHNHTGSGDAWKRTNGGEKDGANALDLGFASRDFKTDETADSKGTIAIDAIVVVVNKKNKTITNITPEMVVKIYKGQVTKWDEVK
ncbi:MAG: substrate-binding domain-containing protein [Acholeplasmataceae bacterium]|jgi:phosphate transport system substrate-binding protein